MNDKDLLSQEELHLSPLLLVLMLVIFLIYLFMVLVQICKENPNIKVQYEPVMLGVLALFLGNAFLGIPLFSGFPIDILSGVVNVFLLFYALIQTADVGIYQFVLWCGIFVFHSCFFKYCSILAKDFSHTAG